VLRALKDSLRLRYLAVLVVLAVAGVSVDFAFHHAASTSPTSEPASADLTSYLSTGLSFETYVDPAGRLASYAFPLVNSYSQSVFVRHVGARVPGLTVLATPSWSAQRPIAPQGSLKETITIRVTNCSLIPHGIVNATLQARTFYGTWQTVRIPLYGNDNQSWQWYITRGICRASH
jgi:hypothetical protein